MGFLKSLIARVGMDATDFEIGAKRVESTTHQMGENVVHEFKKMAAEAFSVFAAVEIVKGVAEYAIHVKEAALQTGLTTKEVQQLGFAAEETGLKFEDFQTSLSKMGSARKDAAEKNNELLREFQRFGVSLDDLQDPAKRNVDLMYQISAAMQHMNLNAGDRQALRDFFGKSGDKLAESISQIDRFKDRPIISDSDITAIDRLEKAIQRLKQAGTAALAPTIAGAADFVSGQINVASNSGFLDQAQGYLRGTKNKKGLELLKNYKDALHYNFSEQSTKFIKDTLLAELDKTAGQSSKAFGAVGSGIFEGYAYRTFQNPVTKKPEAQPATPPPAPSGTSDHPLFHDARADALAKAQAELKEILARNAFTNLSHEKQEADLQKRIHDQKAVASSLVATPQAKLDAQIEAAKLQGQLDSLKRGDTKASPGHHGRDMDHADALARIGGSIGGAVNGQILNIAREQLAATKQIAVNTSHKATQPKQKSYDLHT